MEQLVDFSSCSGVVAPRCFQGSVGGFRPEYEDLPELREFPSSCSLQEYRSKFPRSAPTYCHWLDFSLPSFKFLRPVSFTAPVAFVVKERV